MVAAAPAAERVSAAGELLLLCLLGLAVSGAAVVTILNDYTISRLLERTEHTGGASC